MLRPYQQRAHDAAMDWLRKSIDPCLIEAATGAGKSHVIAAIARTLNTMTGKRVLCLAPSAELVVQNTEKYRATGNKASVFSASAGSKCLRHAVVMGTPGTIKNKIRRFGDEFCAVVIDECHGMTPTVKFIIDQLREVNPRVRVLGLSATPYRLGQGWIFRMDENGKPMEQARDPYFMARVYKVGAHELIQQGFLTPPVIGAINADSYETLGMTLNSRGQFDKADIDRAYHGHGRKTSRIIADVINQSRDRAGVMIFAATVQHAHECMASLPPGLSAIVTGKTPKAERADIIRRFKARQLKYLVNVSVLTTGFDAPHVDVIAILRATESVGLLQQIIGRGLRIDDDKDDCLILDYAENLDRHCPDGDVFNPEIKMSFASGESVLIPAVCPACGTENRFSARKNEEGFEINQHGYFVDLDGNEIPTDHGPMPAHYGRRCMGAQRSGPNGEHERCDYRWTAKKCPHCDADNDIAARYCRECKGEIVDPNDKLKAEFKALKRDPTRIQTDRVIAWDVKPTVGRSGKECIRVDYTTEYRSFAVWYHPWAQGGPMYAAHHQFIHHTNGGETMPETVTYRKNPDNGFYTIHDYGRPADEIPA